MEELVSVVIPIYQTEKYIAECIDSILKQTYTAIEIILVNDGSSDGCDKICEKYRKENSNIHVIHQNNHGPGIARANGVKAAQGKYILFVDSDDCLDGVDVIEKLVVSAQKMQADIVVGSFRTVCEGKISETNYHHLDVVDNTDSVEFRFRGYFQYGHLGFNWGKLYRKDFLEQNKIESLPYPYIEDKAYNMRCTASCPKYAFVKESVYLYRIREKEIPFQDKEDFIPVWTSVAQDFDRYLSERGKREVYGDIVGIHIFLGVYTLANRVLQSQYNKIGTLKHALKEYCSHPFVREQFQILRKGTYIRKLESFIWRKVICITALVCCLRCYGILAMGMKLVSNLKIDQRVIAKKYGK